MAKKQTTKKDRLKQMKRLQSQLPSIYDTLTELAASCKPRRLLIQREVYDWLWTAADNVRFAYDMIEIALDDEK